MTSGDYPLRAQGRVGAAAVLILAAAVASAAGQAGSPGKSGPAAGKLPPRPEWLERFDQLSPAARFQLIEKAGKADAEFEPVARGDVTLLAVARGSLAPALAADVSCTVRNGKGGVAGTIRWVIDEGTPVKKGDLLLELDDSAPKEVLRGLKAAADAATAARAKAAEDVKAAELENAANLLAADIDVRAAALAQKKYAGTDDDEREILKLRVERARLEQKRAAALARSRLVTATAALDAQTALLEQARERVRDAEQQVKACRMLAPLSGMAVYHVPEAAKAGAAQPIVAQGEPVKEGQKLMHVCDLTAMLVLIRVHEAQIGLVRPGQKASVRVDAYPAKGWTARVKEIAAAASAADWLHADVKSFPVQLAVDGDVAPLKPGMSAEVAVEVDRKAGVLRVPVQAVLRAGAEHYCYVKAGQEVHRRAVIPGLRSDLVVEIKAGLKEGEAVLRDPHRLLRRLGVPAGPGQKPAPAGAGVVELRSVPPLGVGLAESSVWTYGLTYQDLRQLEALPAVAQVVPVRRFPQNLRRWHRSYAGAVVGTTPEFADLYDLRVGAGRFLCAEDMEQTRNVVVLGAAVAEALFPEEEPVGQGMVVAGQAYTVVGVLWPDEGDDGAAAERQAAVYLPLPTCRERFGERVITRRGAKQVAEVVQLTEVLLTVRDRGEVPAVVAAVRTLLEGSHAKNDWNLRTW
jgi:multidrug resistance efflux pump